MNRFEDLVLQFVSEADPEDCKYSPSGKYYSADNEFYSGNYWFYEADGFIVDIHDFYIKKDYVENEMPDMSDFMFLISNYLISGSGEWLVPYQPLGSNSMFIMTSFTPPQRYVLHAGSRFFVVGMKFKESMIKECLLEKGKFRLSEIEKVFLDTKNDVIHDIDRLAEEILSCNMSGISADLFFEAKAKEWLSIILNAYEKRSVPVLSHPDDLSLENVASYINDHYAAEIPQSLLEKIAMMSGTKLKYSFKRKYNMTVTEYTQRKRMNIAENLLLTTDMEIRSVAKSVGYHSASRFSTIFKRYKGVFPKDVRKHLKNSI